VRTITFVSHAAALYFADLTRAYHGWTAVVSATDTPGGPRWLVVLAIPAGVAAGAGV
jgi:hypothetical protein